MPTRLDYLYPPITGFGDRLTALLGHPYALARTALRAEIRKAAIRFGKCTILDVGCGSMPYRELFSEATVYHGLEIDQPRNRGNTNVTHWYDGNIFPMPDKSYGGVICSQVLEHSFAPDLLLSEIYRVIEPGGSMLLTIPFFWPEHEQPYDSQRFTMFGLVNRLEKLGFRDIKVVKTNPGLSCLMQLGIEWLESYGRRFRGRMAMLWRWAMVLPYTVMNLVAYLYRNLPHVKRNCIKAELYLDLVVCAKR